MTRVLYFIVIFFPGLLMAQYGNNLSLKWNNEGQAFISSDFHIVSKKHNPFINLQIRVDYIQNNTPIRIYFQEQNGKLYSFTEDKHMPEPGKWFGWLDLPNKNLTGKIIVFFSRKISRSPVIYTRIFYPFSTNYLQKNNQGRKSEAKSVARSPESCNCPYPSVVTRDQWCPNNQCPPNPSPVYTNVQFLIVHHTATPNNESDWAARVRQIWDYHVNTRGWADIGYNYLIDQNGLMYVGRGEDVKGAHFSGHNSGTCGVAYLGTFSTFDPPQVMHDKMIEYAAYKCCEKNLDPLGTAYHAASGLTLHTISGHRDGGNTTCPGDRLYADLPQLRTSTQTRMSQCSNQSIDEESWADMIKVYPNPASDYIIIEIEDSLRIESILLTDMSGRVIRRLEAGNTYMEISTLAPGMYFLKLKVENRHVVKKILIRR